ncbi:38869_t:CDS:2, partial [Gigaspora margarita]
LMTSKQNDQLQPTVNEIVLENELEDNYDYDKPKPWFPMGELKNLLTEIYSDCTLPRTERQKILRGELRNAEIEYQPPQMEQYFLHAMSKQQREFDKIICKAKAEVALKAISPAHTTSRDKKGVFGNKLKDLVEEENTKSKLYNDANRERRRFQAPIQTHQGKEDIKLITEHLEPDLNLRKEIFNKATTTNHGLDQRSDTWTTKAIQTK